jgi:hypothetical protein
LCDVGACGLDAHSKAGKNQANEVYGRAAWLGPAAGGSKSSTNAKDWRYHRGGRVKRRFRFDYVGDKEQR